MGEITEIYLASTSQYRRELLQKLGIPFSQLDPDYPETAQDAESPEAKARRLALGKAVAGSTKVPPATKAVIIGSDQVAVCKDRVLSKPGTFERALEQLQFCAGQWTHFHTGVALVDQTGKCLDQFVDTYSLKFRSLGKQALERYLHLDEPYDCAGSIKAESHGILLLEESKGLDINTLYGLPLIRLTTSLSNLNLLKDFN